MNLTIILIVAIILSIGFHFIGVLAGAKKTVWLMLVLMWAGAINISMSEVKPKAYKDLQKMQGKYTDTDALIKEAGNHVSIYEMINIKHSYQMHKPKE